MPSVEHGASENRLRVAMLGCGRIAQLAHLAILRDHPLARVVAVADVDGKARMHASGMVPAAAVYDDVAPLLHEQRPDAVVIALPTLGHRDAAVAALEAGAHVYLEKPIAASLDDAREIHAAWQRTRLTGRIGFNARFGHLYRELAARISSGEIGEPMAVRSAFTARMPSVATWRITPSLGGGALLELASHHVDLMRWLFGQEIVSVSARTWSNRGSDEAATLDLALASGLHAQAFVSYGTVEEDMIEVYGSEGKLAVNRYDSLIVERSGPFARGGLSSAASRLKSEVGAIGYGLTKRRSPGEEPSFGASLGDFLASAQAGTRSGPDLTDGLRALEVIDAARRSAATRGVIELR